MGSDVSCSLVNVVPAAVSATSKSSVPTVVRVRSRTDLEGAIGSGIYRAFLAGTYSGWNLGESSNPQGIDVDNIYNFTGAPSLTVYRPSGKYRDHHQNVWGHPTIHERDGRCWPDSSTWDEVSPDCDNDGANAPSCLRLAWGMDRFMEIQHDQGSPRYAWVYSYILLWQYIFQDEMPNNSYSVLFTPANIGYKSRSGVTTGGFGQGANIMSHPTQAGVLQEGVSSDLECCY